MCVSKTTKKKTHEETEFQNSIQDSVFTTVYWLYKSAWKIPINCVFIMTCTHFRVNLHSLIA